MVIVPLTPERWPDFVALFERPGPRGGAGPASNGCWCMWWRGHRSHPENRAGMEAIVREGGEPGLLAYDGETVVGWVSVAPRESYRTLMRSRRYPPEPGDAGIWSIVCFYVHAAARHKGVAAGLLDAAVDRAFAHGATAVEAFPHNRRPDYMGAAELFERAGFEPFRVAETRTIMRLSGERRRARGRGRAAPSR